MSQPLNLTNPGRKLHVGVILTKGTTEILDVAPIDIFNGLNKELIDALPDEFVTPAFKAQALDFQFHWVSEAGPSEHSHLTSGISLMPTDSFETCPPLDIVLIGAHNTGYVVTEAEKAYARKAYAESTAFLTICGGVDLALKAGILDGKKATGPRLFLDSLRKEGPGTEWLERRWVRDGKIWTSGALLNGTDMINAFVTEHWKKTEGDLASAVVNMGGWPNRDVEYKDVSWAV